MELDVYQLAAFTAESFGGNPAAVIPLDSWIDDDLMQKIAAENNLSETAYFVPSGDGEWEIRWFTPAVEIDLCGHGTLASAAVIRLLGHDVWPITLRSKSGHLKVDVSADQFVLDFPSSPPCQIDVPEGLEDALGTQVNDCLQGGEMLLAALDDELAVATLRPDFGKLAGIIEHGLIITSRGDEVDFVSRFFAPSIGIDEDPATGSAHCVLTPYWSAILLKGTLEARQISSRVGYLVCEDSGDRTLIKGSTVFFLSGTITV